MFWCFGKSLRVPRPILGIPKLIKSMQASPGIECGLVNMNERKGYTSNVSLRESNGPIVGIYEFGDLTVPVLEARLYGTDGFVISRLLFNSLRLGRPLGVAATKGRNLKVEVLTRSTTIWYQWKSAAIGRKILIKNIIENFMGEQARRCHPAGMPEWSSAGFSSGPTVYTLHKLPRHIKSKAAFYADDTKVHRNPKQKK
ncbi:hypothetical protein WA026_007193 [Henosepilachna vigintioctopunctata]|uniref:Uncharacterized protein n=1 Tax=Henosepilachna vigintioctopunctata TaxID=420089 RepID=A0AAW1V585_9CUCU